MFSEDFNDIVTSNIDSHVYTSPHVASYCWIRSSIKEGRDNGGVTGTNGKVKRGFAFVVGE